MKFNWNTNLFNRSRIGEEIPTKYKQLSLPLRVQDNQSEIDSFFFLSFKNIVKIGLPTTLFFLCIYLQETISLSFIGRKYNNQEMINSIGIVNLYMNCTFLCFMVGLISGLDTLLANALGANNLRVFGLYIHRARLITYLICFLMCVFHYFYALKLISFFNVNKLTLIHCEKLIVFYLIYILLDVQFGINFKVMAVLNKSTGCLLILLLSLCLHPLWCYILINKLDLDLYGAGMSIVISQGINTLLSTLYIHFYKVIPDEAYFGINADCFKGWMDYIQFTLPSAFMLTAEWLAFEVQAVFAIFISKEDYSLHIFLSNLASLLYTLCHGFGLAATILIAEYIAKGMIKEAKAVAVYSFVFSEVTMSICNILLIIFRDSVLSIFIDDKALLNYGQRKGLIIILAIGEIFDITQSVMGSIYRGLGKQRQASIIAFLQYYIVQILFTWLLAFQLDLGVSGIWYSILIGNLLTTSMYIWFLTKIDFGKLNTETKERLQQDRMLIQNEETN